MLPTSANDIGSDQAGSLVWTSGDFASMDFKVQRFQDDPVLTYWNGSFESGFGHGHFEIIDSSYEMMRTVNFQGERGDGFTDFHDFVITADDTFLIGSYVPFGADLQVIDGPEDGWILDCQFQENDTQDAVLFNWSGIDHGLKCA